MGLNSARIAIGFLFAALSAALTTMLFLDPELLTASPREFVIRTSLTLVEVAGIALPVAFPLLLLGEARRIRGLPYWIGCGLLTGLVATAWLQVADARAAFGSPLGATVLLVFIGGLAGGVYWYASGRRAGGLMAAMEAVAQEPISDKRCAICTATVLAVSVLPLAVSGLAATMLAVPDMSHQAEVDAASRLRDAGMPGLSLQIEGTVGKVTGKPEMGTDRNRAFEAAERTLSPFVGAGGVVAVLENRIADGDGADGR